MSEIQAALRGENFFVFVDDSVSLFPNRNHLCEMKTDVLGKTLL